MYRRFLNNNDYLGIITEEALNMLTRGKLDRFDIAEQAAEAAVVDYLSENYEIEKELNKGKYLFEYNRKITYPVGSHFYLEGKICKVIKSINGYKKPSDMIYWEEYDKIVDIASIAPYSQMKSYFPEDVVNFNGKAFLCVNSNGWDFNNIRIPGVDAWEEAVTSEWDAREYNLWDVVSYEGKFFTLTNLSNFNPVTNPMTSDNWGMIADYDDTLDTYELSNHEYVVFNNKVFYPIVNPNADKPENETNICFSDPRNYNLKRHMVQLALYELHKLISPNNISIVRVDDYRHSMNWLRDASRLKLNPQIPRKTNKNGEELMDWQMATFQTKYDPYENAWHI